MAYTVIRTDLMSGTDQRADVFSVQVQDGSGNPIAAENGTIVKLGALIPKTRDTYVATIASSSDSLADCVVLATPEVPYHECEKPNLSDFINEAGDLAMGYKLNGIFQVTKEGFVGGTAPTVGATVGIGTGGKINASGSGLGKCIAIEKAGRYTYYVIKL